MKQSSDFTLGPLMPAHIPQIGQIERLCFSSPWSEQAICDELSNRLSKFIVCQKDGQVLGYVGARIVDPEVYITNIAVLPALRRRGIGRALLCAMMAFARERGMALITLETRVSNTAAIALYEKMGFLRLALRRGYYTLPDEDAYIMTCFLGGERHADTGV